jgi:8-amino-7-oxononanoate synthase
MRDLAAELARLHTEHLFRKRAVVDSPQGAEIVVDGTCYLSFCSNDYLGLANHPQVIAALKEGAEKYGTGSGASHLVTGHQRPHHELEEALAAFTGRPRALLFSTGYMANLGTVTALAGRGDRVYEDRLNHASLLDAGLLSGARLRRYAHNDTTALTRQLENQSPLPPGEGGGEGTQTKLIVSDGVFSMDGDLAPLSQLADIARRHDAWLMVDDAHGLGVLGANGRGTLEHFGLNHESEPILIGTLGKAFGSFGAFVAGGEDLIEYLIQRARPYIYTTALPPAVAHATLTSLRLAREESWRREHLHGLISRFRSGAEQLGANLMASNTPIQPLLAGDSQRALALSEALRARHIYVSAIRPPTVPKGTARLRVTLSAAHSEAQVDRLLAALDAVL